MYVHYLKRLCDYFLAFYVAGYDHTLATGDWLVLVGMVPPVLMFRVYWLCRSLLLVELFIDAFTFFSQVLFSLAALVWALGLGFFILHMHIHCYKVSYHTHSWISGTHINICNPIDHITGKDRKNLLLSIPSVGNKSRIFWSIRVKQASHN